MLCTHIAAVKRRMDSSRFVTRQDTIELTGFKGGISPLEHPAHEPERGPARLTPVLLLHPRIGSEDAAHLNNPLAPA
jgi:hypothetical protein